MIMKDMKYYQGGKNRISCKDSRKKKKKEIEGKKSNRHVVYYICSACNIPASTHMEGTQ
jgi:hypothetical protein